MSSAPGLRLPRIDDRDREVVSHVQRGDPLVDDVHEHFLEGLDQPGASSAGRTDLET